MSLRKKTTTWKGAAQKRGQANRDKRLTGAGWLRAIERAIREWPTDGVEVCTITPLLDHPRYGNTGRFVIGVSVYEDALAQDGYSYYAALDDNDTVRISRAEAVRLLSEARRMYERWYAQKAKNEQEEAHD